MFPHRILQFLLIALGLLLFSMPLIAMEAAPPDEDGQSGQASDQTINQQHEDSDAAAERTTQHQNTGINDDKSGALGATTTAFFESSRRKRQRLELQKERITYLPAESKIKSLWELSLEAIARLPERHPSFLENKNDISLTLLHQTIVEPYFERVGSLISALKETRSTAPYGKKKQIDPVLKIFKTTLQRINKNSRGRNYASITRDIKIMEPTLADVTKMAEALRKCNMLLTEVNQGDSSRLTALRAKGWNDTAMALQMLACSKMTAEKNSLEQQPEETLQQNKLAITAAENNVRLHSFLNEDLEALVPAYVQRENGSSSSSSAAVLLHLEKTASLVTQAISAIQNKTENYQQAALFFEKAAHNNRQQVKIMTDSSSTLNSIRPLLLDLNKNLARNYEQIAYDYLAIAALNAQQQEAHANGRFTADFFYENSRMETSQSIRWRLQAADSLIAGKINLSEACMNLAQTFQEFSRETERYMRGALQLGVIYSTKEEVVSLLRSTNPQRAQIPTIERTLEARITREVTDNREIASLHEDELASRRWDFEKTLEENLADRNSASSSSSYSFSSSATQGDW